MEQRPTKRPPGWLRIVAAVVTVVYCVLLIPDHDLAHLLSTAAFAPLFLVVAIAPQGLFDGRFAAWTQRHPAASIGLVIIFFAALVSSVLIRVFD